jgi:hypothetical protein
MMIEIDRFYNQECTRDMFERRQGPIPWITHTTLLSLLSKFMDGDEMKSTTLPEEWLAEFYRKKGLLWSPEGTQGRGGAYQTGGGYQSHQGGGQGTGTNSYQGGGTYSYQEGYSSQAPLK